jgi:hypothetical protein
MSVDELRVIITKEFLRGCTMENLCERYGLKLIEAIIRECFTGNTSDET